MLHRWFESNDDNFLAQVKDPARRKKRLKLLARGRAATMTSIVIFGVFAVVEGFVTGQSSVLPICALMIALAYTTDLQIKMIKLLSLMQQDSSDAGISTPH